MFKGLFFFKVIPPPVNCVGTLRKNIPIEIITHMPAVKKPVDIVYKQKAP